MEGIGRMPIRNFGTCWYWANVPIGKVVGHNWDGPANSSRKNPPDARSGVLASLSEECRLLLVLSVSLILKSRYTVEQETAPKH